METTRVRIGGGSDTSGDWFELPYSGSSTTTTVTATCSGVFYPQPVEVKIEVPKKRLIPELARAKTKEQLKAWGLRR